MMKISLLVWFLSVLSAVSGTIRGTTMPTLNRENLEKCPWVDSMNWHMGIIQSLDFNYVRIPVSLGYMWDNQLGKLDEIVFWANESSLNIALEMVVDEVYRMDNLSCAWNDTLYRYRDYDNIKMVSFSRMNISRRLIELTESQYPSRFEYVIDSETNTTGIYIENYDTRVHYYIAGEKLLNDSIAEASGTYLEYAFDLFSEYTDYSITDEITFAVEDFKKIIGYSYIFNISDSFIWSYSEDGLLAEGCVRIDWVKVDLIREFWDLDIYLNDYYRIDAPGSPGASTSIGYATNHLLFYT